MTVIAGPTASGKTALAIRLAQALDAEIVSADSQQVYRGFDVGTAKPSERELAQVPHHLVSCVEPLEPFSAARYQRLADAAVAEIAARGRRVVVAGGTGLYLRALLRGLLEAPGADASLRAELEAVAAREGDAALHRRLEAVDPASAARLPAADRVRVIRAIELHALTGLPASAQRAAHDFGQRRYRAAVWVLSPPRDELYGRIDARARAMFAAGLIDEVRSLCARGYEAAAPMRAVGYVQALAVVQGRMSLADAERDVAQKTRHYAKRQLTWFRKEPGVCFVTEAGELEPFVRAHLQLEAEGSAGGRTG